MIVLKGKKPYTDSELVINDLKDLKHREKLDLLIAKLTQLEEETGISYSLVRMQQRTLEIYGLFPINYNLSDRATRVLNNYNKNDLVVLRDKLKQDLSSSCEV